MIGDNPHDLEMARSAGAGAAIGVLTGNSSRQELAPLADAVLDSMCDLPGLARGSRRACRTATGATLALVDGHALLADVRLRR